MVVGWFVYSVWGWLGLGDCFGLFVGGCFAWALKVVLVCVLCGIFGGWCG